MKTYSFEAVIDKEAENYGGKTVQPKGFYYQGKNKKYTVLVGNAVTEDTVRIKILTEHVKITVTEDK